MILCILKVIKIERFWKIREWVADFRPIEYFFKTVITFNELWNGKNIVTCRI